MAHGSLHWLRCGIWSGILSLPCTGWAQSLPSDPTDLSKPEGHSFHGEAFNEGPRQAALLMPGVGKVDFKATTKSPLAARFINQGVAQLHGFWFLEAERSFRQAAAIDPDCAIAFWGMALANKENDERARRFIEQALILDEKTSKREQKYIQAWAKFLSVDREQAKAKSKDKEKSADDSKGKEKEKAPKKDVRSEADKARELIADIEKIILEFPEDLEAKAILCFRLWESEHDSLKITSRLAVDALIGEVLAVEPMHPSHHYRIHLWDGTKGEKALDSAAKCGPSAPGIAHMWHMPGHTYSELKRFHDAVYQQEASARVDHAHMMRTRLLPDQIHNFAHNNEWLIRNMVAIGRVEDALHLASNMISLPRHTKFNKPDGRGSSSFGRDRLIEVLTKFRLWDRALSLEHSVLLDPEGSSTARTERLQLLGMAAFASGKTEKGNSFLSAIQTDLDQEQARVNRLEEVPPSTENREPKGDEAKALFEKYKKQEEKRKKDLEEAKIVAKKLKRSTAFVVAYEKASQKKWEEALKSLDEAESRDHGTRAEWLLESNKTDEAIKKADQFVKDHSKELIPLAIASYVHWKAEKKDSAKEHFEALRKIAYTANLDTPFWLACSPWPKNLVMAMIGQSFPKPPRTSANDHRSTCSVLFDGSPMPPKTGCSKMAKGTWVPSSSSEAAPSS